MSKILMQDLVMKPFVAKFVPWLLRPDQKEHHVAVANDLIQIVTNEPDFLRRSRRSKPKMNHGSTAVIQK